MGFLPTFGLDNPLDVMGGISTVLGQLGARGQALERAGTQLEGGYSQVGTIGGEIPAGGFRLDDDVRGWLEAHNASVNRPGGFFEGVGQGIGTFFSGDMPAEEILASIRTVDDARNLVNEIRKTNPAMADALVKKLNEQLGGQQTTFGASDVKEALLGDFATQTEEAEEDWQRQLRAMGLLESRGEETDRARRDASAGLDRIIEQTREDEMSAIHSLDLAKAGSIFQLADSMRLRQEVLSNFQDNTAIAMETQRGAINFRHQQDESSLRNRLANDPAFSNRPDQIEQMVQNLKHSQRDELFDAAGNMKVQHDNMRASLDMNTAQLEAQAGMAFAGQTTQIAGLESGIKRQFAGIRAETEMNRTQVNVSLDLLDRDGKTELAGFLRDMTRIVVPYAPVLQMAMGLDIAIEDRANNLKWGSEAQANAFWGGLGETLLGTAAIAKQDAANAQSSGASGTAITAGAASGAATGTAIMPGWGTLIGAGVGAGTAYFAGE